MWEYKSIPKPVSKEGATEIIWRTVKKTIGYYFSEDIAEELGESGSRVSIQVWKKSSGEILPVEINCHVSDEDLYLRLLDIAKAWEKPDAPPRNYVNGPHIFCIHPKEGSICFDSPIGPF